VEDKQGTKNILVWAAFLKASFFLVSMLERLTFAWSEEEVEKDEYY
jgi:hypothetical protein